MLGLLGSWLLLDLRGTSGALEGTWAPCSASELVLASLALQWLAVRVGRPQLVAAIRHRTALDGVVHSIVALAVAPAVTRWVVGVYILAALVAHALRSARGSTSGAYAGLLAVVMAHGWSVRRTNGAGWHRLMTVLGFAADDNVIVRGLFGCDWSAAGLAGLVVVLDVCSELVAEGWSGRVDVRRVGQMVAVDVAVSLLLNLVYYFARGGG